VQQVISETYAILAIVNIFRHLVLSLVTLAQTLFQIASNVQMVRLVRYAQLGSQVILVTLAHTLFQIAFNAQIVPVVRYAKMHSQVVYATHAHLDLACKLA
jgi:hypothetical protein